MTMKRTLLCALLVSAACQASAATLYRWVESDGSITFSPEPPAAGVTFETVNTGDSTAKNTSAVRSMNATPAASVPPTASAAASTSAAGSSPREPQIQTLPLPNSSRQELTYAPNAQAALGAGISQMEKTTAAKLNGNRLMRRDTDSVSNQKFDQCQDLKKRVVSLERRLRSTLTPDEVDNTVVAMVRYQQSYDQFCLR